MNLIPEPTRAAGLRRLRDFLPRAKAYAFRRNFDLDGHEDVSRLSPWLRHRLISEAEVCRSVLEENDFASVEKFIQEVCWRTYWKGWLEMRPQVWDRYRHEVSDLKSSLPETYGSAGNGETGIDCFDHWAKELIHTGYLHNHARMWFASIWIFTLQLPWQLGADFFYRHLLDADPASNTLSWRWVAGLQTPGKHYLARAENIRKYTEGRFNPAGLLNESAAPLPAEPPLRPSKMTTADPLPEADGKKRGLLLLGEDLSPETALPNNLRLHAIAGGSLPNDPHSARPTEFQTRALHDAAERLQTRYQCPFTELPARQRPESIRQWAQENKLDEILLFTPPVGPWKDDLQTFSFPVPVRHLRRKWDESLYPRATAGFFRFKKSCIRPDKLEQHFELSP